MRRKLLKAVDVGLGDSLRGLIADACGSNHVPNSWIVLQNFGLSHRNVNNVAEEEHLDVRGLAHAIRVPASEIERRRYQLLPGRSRSFFGLHIHSRGIESRLRRFSPAALALGERHLAVWELRAIPYCAVGWDRLEDTCRCEMRQRWTRTNGVVRCDDCGRPLADMVISIPVPEPLRAALRLPPGIANPVESRRVAALEMLPLAIRQADRSELFDLLIALGRVLQPASGSDFERQVNGLHTASAALIEWPAGLSKVPRPTGIDRSTWSTLTSRYSRLAEMIGSDASDVLPQLRPRAIYQEAKAVDPGVRRMGRPAITRALVEGAKSRAPVGIRTVSQLSKLSPLMLRVAAERNLITSMRRPYGQKVVLGFDLKEVMAFAALFKSRVSLTDTAKALGITVFGVEQLLAMKLITAGAPDLVGRSPYFTPMDLEDMRCSLRQRMQDVDASWIPLVEAIKRDAGGPKLWGPAVRLLLKGSAPFGHETPAAPFKLTSLMVPRSLAKTFAVLEFERFSYAETIFAPRMSQQDALDCLNLSPANSSYLAGLDTIGSGPVTYAVEDVEHRARTIITASEAGRRLGMSPIAARHLLQEKNIRMVMQRCWDRRQFERMFFEL